MQVASGVPGFNNLLSDCAAGPDGPPLIDFAMHARSLGANAEHVDSIAAFEVAMHRARAASKTSVVVIDTDPLRATGDGGWWWEVAVPEVSDSASVVHARADYEVGKRQQRR